MKSRGKLLHNVKITPNFFGHLSIAKARDRRISGIETEKTVTVISSLLVLIRKRPRYWVISLQVYSLENQILFRQTYNTDFVTLHSQTL